MDRDEARVGGHEMGELVDDGTDGLTSKIIGAAITVHRALGPGLFENPYERCVGPSCDTSGSECGARYQ